MKTGLTIRTTTTAPAPGRTRGVSAYVPWADLQPDEWSTFDPRPLAPLDGILPTLAAHRGWFILRVGCGPQTPAWVSGPAGAANGRRPAVPLTWSFRHPDGTITELLTPLPWDANLLYHYAHLMESVGHWLRQPFDGTGQLRSDLCAFVPVACPTVMGTEMTIETQGPANSQVLMAVDSGGPSSWAQRQLGAWRDAIAAQGWALAGIAHSAVAFGPLFNDRLAGSAALAGDRTIWTDTYPMVTNLRLGADGTYRGWSSRFADVLALASQSSPTVCQTAGYRDSGGHPGLSPEELPAAVLDATKHYRTGIVETYQGAITAQSADTLRTLEAALAAAGGVA